MPSIDEFGYINLDPFIYGDKVAIRCVNEDESLHLLAAMMTQYPKRTEYWTLPYNEFSEWATDDGYCYSLDEGSIGRFMHGSTNWHKENGYFIMDFQDLLNNTDTKEYEELDDISVLL